MHYLNIPSQTTVLGEVGAIEPILANKMRQMRIEVRKRYIGTGDAANEELNNSPDIFFKTFKIKANYVDEYQTKYSSLYDWKTKEIKYIRSKAPQYLRIVIALVALIILILGLYNYTQTESKETKPIIKTNGIDSTNIDKRPEPKVQEIKIQSITPKNNQTVISKNKDSNINNGINNGIIGNDNKVNVVSEEPIEFTDEAKDQFLNLLKGNQIGFTEEEKNCIHINMTIGNQRSVKLAYMIWDYLNSKGYFLPKSVIGYAALDGSVNGVQLVKEGKCVTINVYNI